MLDNYYVQGTGNNYRNKAQGDRFVKKSMALVDQTNFRATLR